MKFRRVAVGRVVLALLMAAGLFVAVPAGPASADTGHRSLRNCGPDWYSPTRTYRLSFCSGGWYSDDYSRARAVVDMHSYAWNSSCDCWVDSPSQTLAVRFSKLQYRNSDGISWTTLFNWGSDYGNQCRVDQPDSGAVTCVVHDAVRVSFYSKTFTNNHTFRNTLMSVGWRDPAGGAIELYDLLCVSPYF